RRLAKGCTTTSMRSARARSSAVSALWSGTFSALKEISAASGPSNLAGRAVLIAGPTASGKSALALAVAEGLGAVIVNADSMQVYRDLRVITARPTADDETRAPHELYGFVDAAENYSVGRWCRDVEETLRKIGEQGRVPILVGGTGLYFKALTSGLAAVPPIP